MPQYSPFIKWCDVISTTGCSTPPPRTNSLGGGWTDIQTKEEHQFFSETASVYLQAYREARAEMANTAQQTAAPAVSGGVTGGFNVKA